MLNPDFIQNFSVANLTINQSENEKFHSKLTNLLNRKIL